MNTINNRIKVTPRRPGVRGSICVGGVCFEWQDPVIGFKPQILGWRRPQFPCVMLGGYYGRQLIYEESSGLTYFENEAPVSWLSPNTPADVGGEEVVEGYEDRRVRQVCVRYNQMVSLGMLPGEGLQIPAATFRINDYFMDGEDAFTRSTYMANLGKQPEGVSIAKVFQANSDETFNEYLDQFRSEGFNGAWVRPNDSVWGDVEFFVDEPL